MRAFVTGIPGQDSIFLVEHLLSLNYEVHGLVRRSSQRNQDVMAGLAANVTLHDGDMLDSTSLRRAVAKADPQEVYNLAAQSFVGTSWSQPELTHEVNATGTLRLLEACRHHNPKIKFYQASTSELFGNEPAPQNEQTRLSPRSPYGTSKLSAHWSVINYREAYGMFACCGVLGNHESHLRGTEFVTRKITKALGAIKRGEDVTLKLGNLSSKRDWGYAGDYVIAMQRMLQQPTPQEYVIATGKAYTVEEFLCAACRYMGIARDNPRIQVDSNLFRPAEVNHLQLDASRARQDLDWEPTVDFQQLVELMCEHDR